MPKCKYHKKKLVLVENGSMNSRIKIYNRDIGAPIDINDINYKEILTNGKEFWADVESVRGVTTFDRTNIERFITHEVYMRIIPDYTITAENWMEYKGNFYRIVRVENLGHENRYQQLWCVQLGTNEYAVNYA